ncbi:MAG: radical SAM protein [Coriobacteriia bacterium]|nr:radical SAM protein [Coriobacteriia bacterium]MBN2821637.1 radical SAM protein [Coriobacteriia bacterium]
MEDSRRAWERARERYPADAHLPLPRWATRGLPDGPAIAWEEIARISAERSGAISVYVHIPFCETRCPFCDCHATIASRSAREAVDHYVETLTSEIAAFAALPGLAERPVTTVHFGGGTPLAVGAEMFERVVRILHDSLATHKATEWALESTSRLLDDAHLALLGGLGFTRIHVGVQSMQPQLRQILGRREQPHKVLERIAACLEHGWVVSADLLYGLPGQSAAMLREDIALLARAGIHGVSLYHLNAGPHNVRFMKQHGLAERDETRLREDFTVLAEGAALLEKLGFPRNHVTHFARPQDTNLYSRHALRGEDLLAIGSSADGVMGPYFYRHVELDGYGNGSSLLAGGGVYTPTEERARPLVTRLMAAEVMPDGLDDVALAFCAELEAAGLLERANGGGAWRLTTAGSWFSGAMCAQTWGLYDDARTSR